MSILNKDQHQLIMFKILKGIYQDTAISSVLGFKGGTACYFFYDLPRFSTDLDFDLLDESKIELVFKKISGILAEINDITIKEQSIKRYTIFFLISYGVKDHNIKIEISKRGGAGEYELKDYFGISLLVMKKEDAFANKLIAMTERKKRANRDLFDVHYFMANNWPINEELIKAKTGLSLADYWLKARKFVEPVEQKHILHGIGRLISDQQKQWIKQNLINELLFLLNEKIKKTVR